MPTFAQIGEMSQSGYETRKQFFFQVFSEQPTTHARVLDIGFGGGEYCAQLSARGFAVEGIDISTTAVKFAKTKFPDIQFHEASATDLPFNDESFDMILCLGIFEYMSEQEVEKSISEIFRVLSKNGVVYSMMLSRDSLSYRLGLNFNVSGREEGNRFLIDLEKERLVNAGFKVVDKLPILILPTLFTLFLPFFTLLNKLPIFRKYLPHVFMLKAIK